MEVAEVQQLIDLVGAITSPWSFMLVLGLFGAAPVLVVRLAVLIYPQGHPRRAELIAELYTLKRPARIFYASEVVATALVEGTAERYNVGPLSQASKRLRRRATWAALVPSLLFAGGGITVYQLDVQPLDAILRWGPVTVWAALLGWSVVRLVTYVCDYRTHKRRAPEV